ncbi:MAG: glycosyltransferase [bacterium]
MSHEPGVSVITAVYNGEKYLAEAIESVLDQTLPDFEYIIVDDGSTDKTPGIIKAFVHLDSRINTIRIKNSGYTNALNAALQIARGTWIAVMDADDICFPWRLEEQLEYVKEHPDCILLGSGCMEIDAEGKVIKEHAYPSDHDPLVKNLETMGKFFPHSSGFYRRMPGLIPIRYNGRFTRSQDYDLWLRLSELGFGKIGCVDKTLLKLRRHSYSISNTDSGRLQILMAVAALICHFRRKAGLFDPSRMEEDAWKKFLLWIEDRTEMAEYFHRSKVLKRLRNTWHSDLAFTIKAEAFIIELVRNPLARKVIWERFRKKNPVLKLAEQSKRIY